VPSSTLSITFENATTTSSGSISEITEISASLKCERHPLERLMPAGRVFFLEAASPWSGTLDLQDAETMKAVESYRQRK
jgi:hypothetical protein